MKKEHYSPNLNIRRDEAATMFYRFTKYTNLLQRRDNTRDCDFRDAQRVWPSILNHVVESCRYGIFVGYKDRFSPYLPITNAETMAVLTRALDGYKQTHIPGYHWADKYYQYFKNM